MAELAVHHEVISGAANVLMHSKQGRAAIQVVFMLREYLMSP